MLYGIHNNLWLVDFAACAYSFNQFENERKQIHNNGRGVALEAKKKTIIIENRCKQCANGMEKMWRSWSLMAHYAAKRTFIELLIPICWNSLCSQGQTTPM